MVAIENQKVTTIVIFFRQARQSNPKNDANVREDVAADRAQTGHINDV